MKKALVLGGNGFIGYHLIYLLMNEGWNVTVYDRAIQSRFVDWDVNYIQGELGNQQLIRESLLGIDVVFHLAYTTIPKTSNDDPAYDIQSNVVATVNVLTECVKANVKRVVFLSSGGTVYGVPQYLPVSESHPTKPICSYGITKLMIENYLSLFRQLCGLSYAIIRPSNPYGEEQNILGTQGVIGVFLGRIASASPVVIWGDGSVTRDYFYVGDLARACVMAAESEVPDLLVNIGSGEGVSLNVLLQIIRDTIGVTFDVRYEAGRLFDVPQVILDVVRARQMLGWEPMVSLPVGIRRTWDWILNRSHLHTGSLIK